MKWVFLLMFGSVGLTLFLVGVVWGGKRLALLRKGIRAEGTVVEIQQSTSTESRNGRTYQSVSYYPVVEFAAGDGKTHRFRGSTGSAIPDYEKGAKVELVYDPDNPSLAQIVEFEQFWLGPLAIGLFGFVFLVAGIGAFFMIRSDEKESGPASSFEQEFARAELFEGKRGIPLKASVVEVRGGKDGPVLVCRGGAPGGAERTFESPPLSFDPGPGVVGRSVTVYLDPLKAERYYIDLKPLFETEGKSTDWK